MSEKEILCALDFLCLNFLTLLFVPSTILITVFLCRLIGNKMGELIPLYVSLSAVSLALFALAFVLCLCAIKQKTPVASPASKALLKKPEVSQQPENIQLEQVEPYDELLYDIEDGNRSSGILTLFSYRVVVPAGLGKFANLYDTSSTKIVL